ncbi:hypothetical protein PV963_20695 [Streptomyces coeruleorubidus]|uniref:AlbA family DNA-binding domain-containing protein n=1 Tax=Streptomyces coeruleorubidus TaxID=116188 RepID=UPI00237FB55C|nr:RNA-binding domain-containing protein [Streptomyces coeruleorubidus]WDV52622.1 hypothetical protein PV963_20695 [Streptomyces coeruleorubidus]
MMEEFTLSTTSDDMTQISRNGRLVLTASYRRTYPTDTIETSLDSECEADFKFSDLLPTLSEIWTHRSVASTIQEGDSPAPNKSTNDYVAVYTGPIHGGASVCFTQFVDSPTEIDFDIPSHHLVDKPEMRHRAEVLLLRNNLKMIDFKGSASRDGDPWIITAAWVRQEGEMSTAIALAESLAVAACSTTWPDSLTPADIVQALKQDLAHLLVGHLTEGSEFDAKELIDLKSSSWKIELAKDIAQFANSPTGGLLLIGAKTDKKPGGVEVFRKLAPLDLNPRIELTIPELVQKARDIADAHIHPMVIGLEIASIRTRKGSVMYVYIPPQNPSIQPFIVLGEDLPGGGHFFSIPRRRGDGNLPVSPKEFHRLIAGKLW